MIKDTLITVGNVTAFDKILLKSFFAREYDRCGRISFDVRVKSLNSGAETGYTKVS